MARARRPWSDLRSEIRALLRETDSSVSFWSDTLLLSMFNACMDRRVMQLAMIDEGWVTDQTCTDLVSGQREYTLPEGAGRIKQVTLKYTIAGRRVEVDLVRNDQWGTIITNDSTTSISDYRPTYQLIANLLILEPEPKFSLVGALQIDLESAPARLAGDSDKLDLRFPDVMEVLLIYDCAVLALSQENSQSNQPDGYTAALQGFQQEFAGNFLEYATDRTEGLVFGRPYRQGD